jgi:hypothetical protein
MTATLDAPVALPTNVVPFAKPKASSPRATGSLTPEQENTLADCVARIGDANTRYNSGEADLGKIAHELGVQLRIVADGKLYSHTHDSYETWLYKHFQLSKLRACQFRNHAEVCDALTKENLKLRTPLERQSRALAPVANFGPRLAATWQVACKKHLCVVDIAKLARAVAKAAVNTPAEIAPLADRILRGSPEPAAAKVTNQTETLTRANGTIAIEVLLVATIKSSDRAKVVDAILQQPDAQEIVAMLNEALAKGVSVGEAVS